MTGFAKFLIGAGGASLLAIASHYASGDDYINGLEAQGKAALTEAGYDGVSLTLNRDPLERGATLNGVSDPAERATIEGALAAKGIRYVAWEGEADDGAGEANAGAQASMGASDEAVADCQAGVDTIMEGQTINFKSGSAYIGDDSTALVKKLAESLTACDGMTVAVGGHTDATGSAEANQILSQERADRVAAALAKNGVDAARVSATGFGSAQPKVPGDGANEANRRIEFTLSNGSDAAGVEGEE